MVKRMMVSLIVFTLVLNLIGCTSQTPEAPATPAGPAFTSLASPW